MSKLFFVLTLFLISQFSLHAEQIPVSLTYSLGTNSHTLRNKIIVSVDGGFVSIDSSNLPSRVTISGEGSSKKFSALRTRRTPSTIPTNADGSLPDGEYLYWFEAEYEDSDDSFYFEATVPIVISKQDPEQSVKRVTYIHTDLLGSPVAETDSNGNVVQ